MWCFGTGTGRFFFLFILANLSFAGAAKKKIGRIDFPEKRALTKIKYLLPVYQILENFNERNARKLTLSFGFYTHIDDKKYRKAQKFSFERS